MSCHRALARVDLAAIEHNCQRLLGALHQGGELCAVVKADGYGHGIVQCARAALAGGASWLAVATIAEAEALAQALEARTLIMGPLCASGLERALELDADVVVWRERTVQQLAQIAAERNIRARVHVKLDSGMGRLGTKDQAHATRIAATAATAANVELAGVMTHFATADETDDTFFAEQLSRFRSWAEPLKREHPQIIVHAANSAAVLREPRAHFDMVRCGIAIYGLDPFGRDAALHGLRPALELQSYVAEVKPYRPGESAGYGRRFVAERDTQLAVLPIGYGDGWRRGLSDNGEVLLDGRRYPIVGTISMDSLTVELGPDADAERLRGAAAVLIGGRSPDRISAEDVAARLATINYEITCGLTPRVQRIYHHQGEPAPEVDAP